MLCHECEYPAEDIYDLGEHMYEAHSEREDETQCISFNFLGSFYVLKLPDTMLQIKSPPPKKKKRKKDYPLRCFAYFVYFLYLFSN